LIVSEKILINVSTHKKYYESLGYIIENKQVLIDVNHLKRNSLVKIEVKCDKCEIIKEIRYQDYNKCTKDGSEKYYCSKCKGIKIKKTIENKYGVDNISKLETIKLKKEETCLNNFGFRNPSMSKQIKLKKEETSLKNIILC